jgi:hypothetical protein
MKTIITLVVLLAGCQPLLAGDAWMAGGLGFGSEGIAGSLTGSFQVGRFGLFSARFLQIQQLDQVNGGDNHGGEAFSPGASDIGILVGWAHTDPVRNSVLSLSAGIGSATIIERGEWKDNWIFDDYWDKVQKSATGLLLQGEMFVNKYGVQVYADINSIRSFGGVVVSWRFLHGRTS